MRRLLCLALLLSFVLPAAAFASGSQVVRDCTDDGRLSRRYSQADYAQALANLPTDVDEYSDCRDVIRRAQLQAAGGSGGGSGGSGTFGALGGGGGDGTGGAGGAVVDPLATATPQERAAYDKAVAAGAAPVRLDGRPVTAGTLGGSSVTGLSDLPTPLLVVLALLAAGGLAALALGMRNLVVNRRAT